MDGEYSQWYVSDHAIVGEANGYHDLHIGSAKRGRLQRHGASGGDGESKTKRGSRSVIGLCESIDEHVDNERNFVAKSSGWNVGTVGYNASDGNDFGQQRFRYDSRRDVSVYLYDHGRLQRHRSGDCTAMCRLCKTKCWPRCGGGMSANEHGEIDGSYSGWYVGTDW